MLYENNVWVIYYFVLLLYQAKFFSSSYAVKWNEIGTIYEKKIIFSENFTISNIREFSIDNHELRYNTF